MAKHQNVVDAIRKPRFTMPKFGQDKLADEEVGMIEHYIRSRDEK